MNLLFILNFCVKYFWEQLQILCNKINVNNYYYFEPYIVDAD